MASNAADILIEKINQTRNPSVVGLDPSLSSLPEVVCKAAREKYGNTLKGVAEAFWQFNKEIIDNIAGIVPAVKPQVAFYEVYGVAGIEAYYKTVKYAKEKGLIVIGDCKRNDIGSTAAAYARAHLGTAPLFDGEEASFDVDWLTVNPYLGDDGLVPFVETCKERGKGIFVLVKTSNPSSGQFQDQTLVDRGKTLYLSVAEACNKLAQETLGSWGYSAVGAVVGATYPEQAEGVRTELQNSIFLVPGYGKQGGTADDVVPCFNHDGYGAIVNSSRGVIFAYNETEGAKSSDDWAGHVKQAALTMKEAISTSLGKSGKLPQGW